MTEVRQMLKDLMEQTTSECSQIAKDHDAADYLEQPTRAVKFFYPILQKLQDIDKVVYANRCTGKGSPSLLQELALGMPVLVDLYNTNSVDDFKKRYEMLPTDFANEVKAKRIVPILNTEDPENWSENSLDVIKSILQTGNVQWAAKRTEEFQNWFSQGKVDDIKKEGGKILTDYFSYKEDSPEEAELFQQLRIDPYQNPRAEYSKVVIGRWRNIISIAPQLKPLIIKTFDEFHHQPVRVRITVLNGLKNLISSPMSAGRGGLYRAGQGQIDEIASLQSYQDLSQSLKAFLPADENMDVWTHELINFFEEKGMIPAVKYLDYDRYKTIVEENYWQDFREGTQKVLTALLQRTDSMEPELIKGETLKIWEETCVNYEESLRSYNRAENLYKWIVGPLLDCFTYFNGLNIIGFSVLTHIVKAGLLDKLEEKFGTGQNAGRILAHLYFKGRIKSTK